MNDSHVAVLQALFTVSKHTEINMTLWELRLMLSCAFSSPFSEGKLQMNKQSLSEIYSVRNVSYSYHGQSYFRSKLQQLQIDIYHTLDTKQQGAWYS